MPKSSHSTKAPESSSNASISLDSASNTPRRDGPKKLIIKGDSRFVQKVARLPQRLPSNESVEKPSDIKNAGK